MTGDGRAVAGRIRLELVELHRVIERTRGIWAAGGRSADDYYVDAVALNLHGFYAGLERVFELVADRIDRSVPTGPSWHQELLRQMASELPEVRPAAISVDLLDRLDRYRGFRHVVRNVYTYQLDHRQIAPLVDDLQGVADMLEAELSVFAERLEEIGGPVEGAG